MIYVAIGVAVLLIIILVLLHEPPLQIDITLENLDSETDGEDKEK